MRLLSYLHGDIVGQADADFVKNEFHSSKMPFLGRADNGGPDASRWCSQSRTMAKIPR
jgi:hypothetical protein